MSATTTLVKRLQELGLSQVEIQRETGIPQPRISKWLNGKTPKGADDSLLLANLVERKERAAQRKRAKPAKVEG